MTSVRSRFSRSEEHTSELQSQSNLVCRLLLEKKNCTVKDVPSKPDELTKDGKRKLLPVCFKEDFVIILTEYPPDLRIGDKVNVVLVKLARSHSKQKMAFGAVRDGR